MVVQYQEAGKPMSASFSVRNHGDFPVRMTRLVLRMEDPSGDSTMFGATEVQTLAPGGEAGAAKQVASFPNEAGTYDLTAEFVNAFGKAIRVPETALTTNEISFHPVGKTTKLKKLPKIEIARPIAV